MKKMPQSDTELLDFVIECSVYPSEFRLSAASTGKRDQKFYCSFGPEKRDSLSGGIFYGTNPRAAIYGALRLRRAQQEAQAVLDEAKRRKTA